MKTSQIVSSSGSILPTQTLRLDEAELRSDDMLQWHTRIRADPASSPRSAFRPVPTSEGMEEIKLRDPAALAVATDGMALLGFDYRWSPSRALGAGRGQHDGSFAG